MIYYLDSTDIVTDKLESIITKVPLTGLFLSPSVTLPSGIDSSLKQYIVEDDKIKEDRVVIGKILQIDNEKDMQSAMNADDMESLQMIIIETSNWKIIPLENLIAKYANSSVQILAKAKSPEDIELLEGVLEIGVNGCVLSFTDHEQYNDFEIKKHAESFDLSLLKVAKISKIGIGDRVCVDTCTLLKFGEGLLVGATAGVFGLTEAEVEETGYVNARPFRVNAGVVASYILNGRKTNYLSELRAGSEVMIVNKDGKTRKEVVARIKIEKRPLILVEVNHLDRTFPIILQDAETVKLQTKTGSIRVSELKEGDEVLCFTSSKARHFGMEIDEFLEER